MPIVELPASKTGRRFSVPFEVARPKPRRRIWTPDDELRIAAPAYVQFGIGENSSSSPQVVTRTGTAANNVLCVMAANTGSTSLVFGTPTDDALNSYAPCVGASASSGTLLSGFQMNSWWCVNKTSGTRTISVPWTGSKSSVGAYVFEISGATAYDNGAGAAVPSPSSAGSASTGNFTALYQDIIICIDINDAGNGAAGAGYTFIEVTPDWGWTLEYGLFNAGTNAGLVAFGFQPDSGIMAAAFGAPPTGGIGVPFWAA